MQFPFRKRYRFIYPAGLISLVLLPLLGIMYYRYILALQQQYVIPYLDGYSHSPDPLSLRNYKTYKIGGKAEDNKIIISEAQSKIHQLMLRKDEKNGVHLIFEKESNYGVLIETLNICLKENATYFPQGKNLYVLYAEQPFFYTNAEPEFPTFFSEGNCTPWDPPFFSPITAPFSGSWQQFKFQFNTLIQQLITAKSFWPAGILYIIMVSLTAQKVVRQIRKPTI